MTRDNEVTSTVLDVFVKLREIPFTFPPALFKLTASARGVSFVVA